MWPDEWEAALGMTMRETVSIHESVSTGGEQAVGHHVEVYITFTTETNDCSEFSKKAPIFI
jgi:hypothetical protein